MTNSNDSSIFNLDFGYKILVDLSHGREWSNTLVFPRISFCVFSVKHSGSVVHQMAQCALPINMINEKIYVFLWFWFVLCTILNVASMVVWIVRIMFLHMRIKFVKRFLKLSCSLDTPDNGDIRKFVKEFLRHDGSFIVRMIALNAGDLICCEVVCGLYEKFAKYHYDVDFRGMPVAHMSNRSRSYSLAIPLGDNETSTVHRKSAKGQRRDPVVPSAPLDVDVASDCPKICHV